MIHIVKRKTPAGTVEAAELVHSDGPSYVEVAPTAAGGHLARVRGRLLITPDVSTDGVQVTQEGTTLAITYGPDQPRPGLLRRWWDRLLHRLELLLPILVLCALVAQPVEAQDVQYRRPVATEGAASPSGTWVAATAPTEILLERGGGG